MRLTGTIEERCRKLAEEAVAIRSDAEWRESLTRCRGHLTDMHLSMATARHAVARAKDAIDRLGDEADAFGMSEVA